MRLVLVLLMFCGGLITVQPAFTPMRVVQIWSDFKAFGARVTEREDGKAVLALGGERELESFDDLLRKLWELRCCTAIPYLGILVSVLSALALVVDIRRKRIVEPSAGPNDEERVQPHVPM